jgi:hypothetical protein
VATASHVNDVRIRGHRDIDDRPERHSRSPLTEKTPRRVELLNMLGILVGALHIAAGINCNINRSAELTIPGSSASPFELEPRRLDEGRGRIKARQRSDDGDDDNTNDPAS